MIPKPNLSAIIFCLLTALSASAADPTTRPDLHIGKLHVNKVLFIGNSITLHGPAKEIGWLGNWGMAASAQEKDYVHLLINRITEAAKGKPQARIGNIANFERQHATFDIEANLKDDLSFEADLVIIAIGENVPALGTDDAKKAYAQAFAKLLTTLQKHGHPTLIVRSCFWPDATKDTIMQTAAKEAGATFVDISKQGQDPNNQAKSERKIDHAGVAAHPGDKGMQAIADAIWTAIASQ